MNCIVLETPEENGEVEWGVSFLGSNPEPDDYVACKSEADAWRLEGIINSWPQRSAKP